ncbi:SNF2/RAD54 family helicase [Streptomyces zinciresistens K42]|uniref:SNF2/RAD54 family helicase n=1 Tax=Streptomyces zinciresistens K42 TaxID=700597 RepID=G2G8V8_9ACTN|nr:hypothetical protein [Streptomyces zinciresistens]EGX60020.1 SNF2/RAD54 family helicase [Streptomyces zinciresistens K42]
MPGDPTRTRRIAFWRAERGAVPSVASGSVEELTVVLPGPAGVEPARVPAVLPPVRAAVPLLVRARRDTASSRAAVLWGTAAALALRLTARGLLLPGLSPEGHGAWRAGPLQPDGVERLRALAAAMPPEAHAVPVEGVTPLRLTAPEHREAARTGHRVRLGRA